MLKVDGGVTINSLRMQLQAGVPGSRPAVAETTGLGAACVAGLAVGFWKDTAELRANYFENEGDCTGSIVRPRLLVVAVEGGRGFRRQVRQ